METGTDIFAVLPDIPRLFTALAEWLACMVCIATLKKKMTGWKLMAVSALALAVFSVFLTVTDGLTGIAWVCCMLAAAGIMWGFLYITCKGNGKESLFYCMWAFIAAEFAASLEWQIYCFFYNTLHLDGPVGKVGMLIGIYGVVYLCIWKITQRLQTSESRLELSGRELAAVALIVVLAFSLSNLGFVFSLTPFSGRSSAEIFNIRTLVDLGGMAIVYAYYMQCRDIQVRHELESIQNILHAQYRQYEQSQRTVDMIHYKYHDLKHHIIALRAEEDGAKRNQYLDRMEEEIRNFETQNKTGNKVLDTLLSSKSMYCIQHGISLTCVVDGTLFDFMDVMDICSIFGNAMDNAIEYEKQVEEEEKRLIHVSAFSQKNFLIIRFENYYEGSMQFEENLPVTTKKEKEFHGYGLKSLRYTVHKYKGEVDISVQDNWFNLKILIPL